MRHLAMSSVPVSVRPSVHHTLNFTEFHWHDDAPAAGHVCFYVLFHLHFICYSALGPQVCY